MKAQTEAQRAAAELYASVPRERITTHERRAPRPLGSHGTLEERAAMRDAVRRCKALGYRKMKTAALLNLDPKTVARYW